MSDFSDISLADLEQNVFQTCCALSALVLLVYDQLLTFSKEINLVWNRKFSLVTLLFVFNRYLNLLGQSLQVVAVIPWTHRTYLSCEVVMYMGEALEVINLLIVALFAAFRIYAIWGHAWRPTLPVLLISLTVPAINLYFYSQLSADRFGPPLLSCGTDVHLSLAQFLQLRIAFSACGIAADTLVIALTLAKTYGIKRFASRHNIETNLLTLLLRDGTLYFLILLVLHLIDFVTGQSTVSFNPTPQFIDAFQAILISRFILNLRLVLLSDPQEGTNFSSINFTAPRFASSIIGNMGAPLDHGDWSRSAVYDYDSHEGAELEPAFVSTEPIAAGLAEGQVLRQEA